jgi:glucosamine 6-phosphate synthetase-like amidotransferase/phosphosugar isomerase protein
LLDASGNAAADIVGAAYSLPVPEARVPLLAPLFSVVPGELFAASLARAKGFDADSPTGLSKATLAR